jgi:putative oxidoreductase
MNEFLNSWSPRVLSILRFMTGFLMMWHGTQKLFGYPPSQRPPSPDGGMDALTLVGGILEFGGGVLFLIGFLTRPVAFLLSGTMAVAYWMAHGTRTFLPIQNGGELAALYCFVFLYFVFAGGGAWSVDNLVFGKNRTENNS